MDALYAIHDCAVGISPVTSYSGVKRAGCQPTQGNCVAGSALVLADTSV